MDPDPSVLRLVNGFVAVLFFGGSAATFAGVSGLPASPVLAVVPLLVAVWAVLGIAVPAIGPARIGGGLGWVLADFLIP